MAANVFWITLAILGELLALLVYTLHWPSWLYLITLTVIFVVLIRVLTRTRPQ